MMTKIPSVNLINHVSVPQIGLGVYRVKDDSQVKQAIKWALDYGYRHIDTAKVYGNEESVGEAIAESGIPRRDLFITSKLWNSDHGAKKTRAAIESSLSRLGLDYLDMYLIHWPTKGYVDSWHEMEKMYKEGLIRAIGVSNFDQKQLQKLMNNAEINPMVDQIETHPLYQQKDLHAFLMAHGIAHEAWGPLGQGIDKLMLNPTLCEIGRKYVKTVAQVILRWHIQRNTIVIPKSIHLARIHQNFDVFNFELSDEEMQAIAQLDEHKHASLEAAFRYRFFGNHK